MIATLCIGIGAALGAWLRWIFDLALNPILATFALGTLASNLLGCFLIGLAIPLFDAAPHLSPAVRSGISTGFLGGLTTFSAFSGETMILFEMGKTSTALLVIVLNLGGSLTATLLGLLLSKAILVR